MPKLIPTKEDGHLEYFTCIQLKGEWESKVKYSKLKSLFSDPPLCTNIHCSVLTQEGEMPLEEESKSDLNCKFARGEERSGEENSRPPNEGDLKSKVLRSVVVAGRGERQRFKIERRGKRQRNFQGCIAPFLVVGDGDGWSVLGDGDGRSVLGNDDG
nr:hypothetical protein Iba_chr05eCG9050 [Ipomoea batatas]